MRQTAILIAIAMLTGGCTARLETAGNPKVRTYSTHIQTITNDSRCQTCHATDRPQGAVQGLGTYAFDITKKNIIRDMAADNAKDFVTAEKLQDLNDWIQAGAPNDDKPF